MRDDRAVPTVDEAQTSRPTQEAGKRMFENIRSHDSFAGEEASGCVDLGRCAAGA